MPTPIIDVNALIEQFSSASARQTEQLRQAVYKATLGALQGRELTLQNIRSVLKSVSQAAATGAAQNTGFGDSEALLSTVVQGMDDALLKAVDANRVALQQFVERGADLREKHLKKAVADLEKIEDALFDSVGKALGSAGEQVAAQWQPVLEKLKLSGTQSGTQAATTVQQLGERMRTAMRDTRASGLRAAQALAESYTALVSGVLIGMSEALEQSAAGKAKKP